MWIILNNKLRIWEVESLKAKHKEHKLTFHDDKKYRSTVTVMKLKLELTNKNTKSTLNIRKLSFPPNRSLFLEIFAQDASCIQNQPNNFISHETLARVIRFEMTLSLLIILLLHLSEVMSFPLRSSFLLLNIFQNVFWILTSFELSFSFKIQLNRHVFVIIEFWFYLNRLIFLQESYSSTLLGQTKPFWEKRW